jgi:glycerol kinase
LCKAIVWDDARTKNVVKHYENKLQSEGIELEDGTVKKGDDGVKALREL